MPLSEQWRKRRAKRKQVNTAYRLYLQSKHWKETKALALEAATGHCEKCGQPNDRLNVHHKHYKSLGHEKPGDLLVLCPKCHAKVHRRKWW